MSSQPVSREFRPEKLSRRSEWMSWALVAVVAAAWALLVWLDKPVYRGLPFLGALLLFLALGTSLSNWMDRRMLIQLGPEGILFDNGLRHVEMKWDEIQQVRIFPSPWGKKVSVIGSGSHFEFRTLGEVKVQGEVKGRMGFTEGEHILSSILQSAHLKRSERTDTGYSYYSRE